MALYGRGQCDRLQVLCQRLFDLYVNELAHLQTNTHIITRLCNAVYPHFNIRFVFRSCTRTFPFLLRITSPSF